MKTETRRQFGPYNDISRVSMYLCIDDIEVRPIDGKELRIEIIGSQSAVDDVEVSFLNDELILKSRVRRSDEGQAAVSIPSGMSKGGLHFHSGATIGRMQTVSRGDGYMIAGAGGPNEKIDPPDGEDSGVRIIVHLPRTIVLKIKPQG